VKLWRWTASTSCQSFYQPVALYLLFHSHNQNKRRRFYLRVWCVCVCVVCVCMCVCVWCVCVCVCGVVRVCVCVVCVCVCVLEHLIKIEGKTNYSKPLGLFMTSKFLFNWLRDWWKCLKPARLHYLSYTLDTKIDAVRIKPSFIRLYRRRTLACWSLESSYEFCRTFINPFRSYIGPRPTVWFSSSAPMSEDVRNGFCCVCSPAVGACPTLFLV
jgi:hypothetical protein